MSTTFINRPRASANARAELSDQIERFLAQGGRIHELPGCGNTPPPPRRDPPPKSEAPPKPLRVPKPRGRPRISPKREADLVAKLRQLSEDNVCRSTAMTKAHIGSVLFDTLCQAHGITFPTRAEARAHQVERQSEKAAAARADLAPAVEKLAALSSRAIAAKLGLSSVTVQRIAREHGIAIGRKAKQNTTQPPTP